jgi:hypothetical protein
VHVIYPRTLNVMSENVCGIPEEFMKVWKSPRFSQVPFTSLYLDY